METKNGNRLYEAGGRMVTVPDNESADEAAQWESLRPARKPTLAEREAMTAALVEGR